MPDVAVGPSLSPRAEIKARGTFMRHVSDTLAYLNLGKTWLGVLLGDAGFPPGFSRGGSAWVRTYERESSKKASADVTTACWRRGRSAHHHRGVRRGPHERQPAPSEGYLPTGG